MTDENDHTTAGKIENSEFVCPHCGECSPTNFAVCWNCGQNLAEAEKVTSTEPAGTPEQQSLSWRSIRQHLTEHRTDWCVLLATLVYRIVTHSLSGRERSPEISPWEYLPYLPYYCGWSMLLWVLIRRDGSATQPISLIECRWWSEWLWALPITIGSFFLWYALIFVTYDMRLPDSRFSTNVDLNGWVRG